MKQSHMLVARCVLPGRRRRRRRARRSAEPDRRQGDFVHVCQGGPNKAQPCTVATQDDRLPEERVRAC